MRKKQVYDVTNPEKAVEAAIRCQNDGQLKHAEGIYKALIKKHPQEFDGLHFYGLLCAQRNNFEKAEKLLTAATCVDPESSEAHNNLGNALQARQRFAEAHYNLGKAYAAVGRYRDAVESYRQATELQPGYAEADNNLGTALKALSRYHEAEASFRTALALQPSFVKARVNLGNALGALSLFDTAMDCYEAALKQVPDLCALHLHQCARRG